MCLPLVAFDPKSDNFETIMDRHGPLSLLQASYPKSDDLSAETATARTRQSRRRAANNEGANICGARLCKLMVANIRPDWEPIPFHGLRNQEMPPTL